MILCFTRVYGSRALYPTYVFVLLEGLLYGFGFWFISYLYVWAVLVFVALAFRRTDSCVVWAAVSAGFGLVFGAFCAIPYFFIGGWEAGFSYWVSGIPFPLLHCGGTAELALLLLKL
jgi:energy-coupling factor transport system substrate-specific component